MKPTKNGGITLRPSKQRASTNDIQSFLSIGLQKNMAGLIAMALTFRQRKIIIKNRLLGALGGKLYKI